MGTVNITKLNKDDIFTNLLQEIHCDLLEAIENHYDVQMSEDFWAKMNGPNLAYLNFEGRLNQNEEKVTYIAHSGINNYKATEPITEYLDDVYEFKPITEKYKSGFVSRNNRILTYRIDDIIQKPRSGEVWKRDVDSESKLIETFLDRGKGVEKLEGELLLYTFYYPCLSCSNKMVKVITQLSQQFPGLNIEIWYLEEYGY